MRTSTLIPFRQAFSQTSLSPCCPASVSSQSRPPFEQPRLECSPARRLASTRSPQNPWVLSVSLLASLFPVPPEGSGCLQIPIAFPAWVFALTPSKTVGCWLSFVPAPLHAAGDRPETTLSRVARVMTVTSGPISRSEFTLRFLFRFPSHLPLAHPPGTLGQQAAL